MYKKNLLYIFILFLLATISIVTSCAKPYADAQLTVPTQHVDPGKIIVFDASRSQGDVFTWYLDNVPYGNCKNEEFCPIEFENDGRYIVSVKVKRDLIDSLSYKTTEDKTKIEMFVGLPNGAGYQGEFDDNVSEVCGDSARVRNEVAPTTWGQVGDLFVFTARESNYDVIRWDIRSEGGTFVPIGQCNHESVCELTFDEVGSYFVKIKVKRETYTLIPLTINCPRTTAESTAKVVIYPQ